MTTINPPAGKFLVIAQLTENSKHKGATDKGHRYFVRESFNDGDEKRFGDMGKGTYCNTIDQARNRIKYDTHAASKRTDASGLIDWGSYTPRAYAIFPVTFGKAVE